MEGHLSTIHEDIKTSLGASHSVTMDVVLDKMKVQLNVLSSALQTAARVDMTEQPMSGEIKSKPTSNDILAAIEASVQENAVSIRTLAYKVSGLELRKSSPMTFNHPCEENDDK